MEVNADMNSTSTGLTSCELATSSSQKLLPGCTHWFVYVKKTFLVHP